MSTLIVCNWHTECSCGYGSGGPYGKRDDDPILDPSMLGEKCPGCGEVFDDEDRQNSS